MLSKFSTLILVYALMLAGIANGAPIGVNLSVNPFYATGDSSSSDTIENITGVKGAAEKLYRLPGRIIVGPRAEFGYSYMNTSERSDQNKTISTMDHRYILGGIKLGREWGPSHMAHQTYFAVGTGRGYSKVKKAHSGSNFYNEVHINKIEGNQVAGEIGGNFRIKRDLSFNLSAFGHYYEAEFNKATATSDGVYAENDGSVRLMDSTAQNEKDDFPSKIVYRTLGVSLGFSLDL